MQPEPDSTTSVPAAFGAQPSDPQADARKKYNELVTSMREQNKQTVAQEIHYLDTQVEAGELTTETDDYRGRLDAIDAMRRTCRVRRTWTYAPHPDKPTQTRTQDYALTIDETGNIWAEWKKLPGAAADEAGQQIPDSGKRLCLKNPDAPEDTPAVSNPQ